MTFDIQKSIAQKIVQNLPIIQKTGICAELLPTKTQIAPLVKGAAEWLYFGIEDANVGRAFVATATRKCVLPHGSRVRAKKRCMNIASRCA